MKKISLLLCFHVRLSIFTFLTIEISAKVVTHVAEAAQTIAAVSYSRYSRLSYVEYTRFHLKF